MALNENAGFRYYTYLHPAADYNSFRSGSAVNQKHYAHIGYFWFTKDYKQQNLISGRSESEIGRGSVAINRLFSKYRFRGHNQEGHRRDTYRFPILN